MFEEFDGNECILKHIQVLFELDKYSAICMAPRIFLLVDKIFLRKNNSHVGVNRPICPMKPKE